MAAILDQNKNLGSLDQEESLLLTTPGIPEYLRYMLPSGDQGDEERAVGSLNLTTRLKPCFIKPSLRERV